MSLQSEFSDFVTKFINVTAILEYLKKYLYLNIVWISLLQDMIEQHFFSMTVLAIIRKFKLKVQTIFSSHGQP